MALQSRFIRFHETIKLHRFQQNQTLREKRDAVLNRVREGLSRRFSGTGQAVPTFEPINIGSYEMGTGVKPRGGDYDIDVGLKFNIDVGRHQPLEVKGWVYDAVAGHTHRVEWREPVVTVYYHRQGEPIFHVDLAVYGSNRWGQLHLARGKRQSSPPHSRWEPADPVGLINAIKIQFNGDGGAQFRRTIRYLKRWRDQNFPSEGNAAPVGIGLTVAGYQWFSPKRASWLSNDYNDLAALRDFVDSLLPHFSNLWGPDRLRVELPVTPHSDVFGKMTDEQMTQFRGRLQKLSEALRKAADAATYNEGEAARQLATVFGPDFPAS